MNVDQTLMYELLIALFTAAQTPPSLQPKVVAIGEFKNGESCVSGFKRIGYKVTVSDCVDAAKKAKIDVLWYAPPNGRPVIIVPVKEGDPFAVIRQNNNFHFVLHKKPTP